MFLLFAGDYYYPSGGWNDFRGQYPTLEAAIEAVAFNERWEWAHVVDYSTMSNVWSKGD